MLLTEIIGHFVCAVCKHPEEDPPSAADALPSFIHPRCYEHSPGLHALHEHITADRHVLPGTQERFNVGHKPGFYTVKLAHEHVEVLEGSTPHHWWSPMTLMVWSASATHVMGLSVRTWRKVKL